MTIRLRVRHFAEQRGLNLAEFQRKAQLPVTTSRRVWYSTADGSPDGEPLRRMDFDVLEKVASYFGVPPGDLLMVEEDAAPDELAQHPSS